VRAQDTRYANDTMASSSRQQRVDIHELQREMMASDLREEKARTAAALSGKTGARRTPPPPGRGRREGFDGHYPSGAPPGGSGGPYDSETPAGNYRPGRSLDVHEILKHEAASCDDHFEKSRPCPRAVYGVSDQYMILDSYEKVQDSRPEHGQFRFNFMVQGVTRDQNIGVKDRLDTIIGIQVCDFSIPLLPFDDFAPAALYILNPGLPAGFLAANGPLPTSGTPVNNPQSQIPFSSRVTMFLKEIGLQSYSDADNRRHHFEFDATLAGPSWPGVVLGDRILLTPLDDCEYFLFTDPIQDVHGLTVCFYNPGAELRFPPDVLYAVAAAADFRGRLTFTYTDPTNLINLAVGDRIYILGFTSGNGTLDTYLNRPEGHIVGGGPDAPDDRGEGIVIGPDDPGGHGFGGFSIIPPTSSTSGTLLTFRLNPDVIVTSLTPPFPASDARGAYSAIPSSTQIDVRIAKNRLRIPLRFRRVVGRHTNYIAP
jgi:hypothetical protein